MRLSTIIIVGTALTLSVLAQDLGTEAQRQAGQVLYDNNCSQCHGAKGNGEGVAYPYLKPEPRDFTAGKYKIRTTPTGAVPTHQDLKDIIRRGMPFTSMPAWPDFSDQELNEIVYYLKSFYPGFDGAQPEVVDIPSPPSPSAESIEKGRQAYVNLGCIRCHGEAGRGDGPAAREQTNDWGFHLRPADLTKPWTFRGGSRREDVYRTFMTGLNGTPMPSYGDPDVLPVEDRWPLVDYIFSLSDSPQPNYSSFVSAVSVPGEVSLERGREMFESAPLARFPIIGQIIEPGRDFYPSAVEVEVRAVFDRQDIALLVEWNDIFAETEGVNGPDITVPPFDPEEAVKRRRIGGQGGGDEAADDPFGDPFGEAEAPADASSEEAAEAPPEENFTDAVAVQFPLEMPSGNRKPYFIFGDAQNGAELWYTEMGTRTPRLFVGRGSVSVSPRDGGEPFQVKAEYQDGRWSVIFKRKRISRKSISFEEATFVPIAFSVWDGFNKERGNKRGLSSWFYLHVEEKEKPSLVWPMARNALAVLGLQALIVFAVRRKFAQKTEEQSGG